jgi:hypothetical protein
MISPNNTTPDCRILEANLQDAITIAIIYQRAAEAKISPTYCSSFRAGLEANLSAMRAGQRLQIEYN